MFSIRRSSLPEPPVLSEEISTSSRLMIRYSTWESPPALRTVRVTLGTCLPLEQCIIRLGVALSTNLVSDISWMLTLPAPPPVPVCMLPDWDMHQLQLSTSISSLWV